MKALLFATAVLVSFSSSMSLACKAGDTSKQLLVLPVSNAGEQNAVIGAIITANGTVSMSNTRFSFVGQQGSLIKVESDYDQGQTYIFDTQKAQSVPSYCYAVIYPN